MGRRSDVDPAPTPGPDLDWRYRWLSRAFWATEATSDGHAGETVLAPRLRARAKHLDATALTVAEKLADIEGLIAAAGMTEQAERFLAYLIRCRESWTART